MVIGCSSQRWADTNVTLAFEDAQAILPFYREDTDDTDDIDDTDETDYTDDTDDTGCYRLEYAGIGWIMLE